MAHLKLQVATRRLIVRFRGSVSLGVFQSGWETARRTDKHADTPPQSVRDFGKV